MSNQFLSRASQVEREWRERQAKGEVEEHTPPPRLACALCKTLIPEGRKGMSEYCSDACEAAYRMRGRPGDLSFIPLTELEAEEHARETRARRHGRRTSVTTTHK